MKFVYFGYDFAIKTVYRLLDEGHELLGIFTFPCDNVFSFNTQLMELAKARDIPITTEKVNQSTINHWLERDCELFLSAGYLYKIPHIPEDKAFAINIHPSLLPQGRGIMPLPTILMSEPNAAGITAHKITDKIDAGDIIAQHPLTLHDDETVETLSTRIAMQMPDMTATILQDLPNMWKNASPQDKAKASTFAAPTDAMRSIDWAQTTEEIKTLHRAFGRYGILFQLGEDQWVAYALSGWSEKHTQKPGTIAHTTPREITIATQDGYICITDAEQVNKT